MRKIILPLIIILVIIVGLGLVWFFMQRQTKSYSENSAFKAIPVRTPLVLEITDVQLFLQKLETESPLVTAMKEIPELESFRNDVNALRTVVSGSEGLKTMLAGRPALVAFNPEGKENIGCLFALSLENRAEKSDMVDFIESYSGQHAGSLTRRSYDDVEIFRLRKGDAEFHFAENGGIFIFSRHAIFVEEAIRQMATGNLLDQDQFKNLYNTKGSDSDFNIFINHEKINIILAKAASPAFRQALQLFVNFADRTELDVNLKPSEVLLGGFSFSEPTKHNYLNIFRNQEAERFNLGQVIPSGVSGFLALNLSDFERYQVDYNEFLKGRQGNYYRREANLKGLEQYSGKPFVPLFQQVAGNDFAIVFGQVTQNEPASNRFFIAGVKGQSLARDLLLPMIEKYARANQKSLKAMQSTYQIQSNKGVTIYEFPFRNLPGLLMGESFTAVESNYLCFYDNYLIFSDDITALKNYLHDLMLSDTLEKDVRFQTFSQQMVSKSTFYFYLNFSKAFYLKNHYLNEAVSNALQNNEEGLRKFHGLGWQFSASSGEFLNNLYLKYDPVLKEEPQAIWQAKLDSTISIKPQLVVNHKDKQNLEVIVQDNRNNLYLINKEGATLWKVQLPGKIMSPVYQIDYYRNGKLQYFFNTRDQLHLIDRNGSNVARFPVTLKAPASNGVAVVDYAGNRDYRYFVASDDRRMYAFDREGKLVTGWKFEGTDGVVTNPLRHHKLGTQDFLVFSDRYKTYILDRQGNTRVKTTDHFEHSGNDLYLTDKGALATTDAGGKVHLQYFDGKSETISTGSFGKGHFFRAEDLNGDKKTDYIVADGNELVAYTDQGKKIFERKFESAISFTPDIYTFGAGNRKIGVVCRNENRIYLVDTRGGLYSGFPLQGSTPFSMGCLTSGNPCFNLLVGSEDNRFFNYKIE
ncbi:MAG: hypothetical protein PHI28_12010 [Mangrovibacterium sp.]|nr:hypothetical protein [Mangrovibacterium sp.]